MTPAGLDSCWWRGGRMMCWFNVKTSCDLLPACHPWGQSASLRSSVEHILLIDVKIVGKLKAPQGAFVPDLRLSRPFWEVLGNVKLGLLLDKERSPIFLRFTFRLIVLTVVWGVERVVRTGIFLHCAKSYKFEGRNVPHFFLLLTHVSREIVLPTFCIQTWGSCFLNQSNRIPSVQTR